MCVCVCVCVCAYFVANIFVHTSYWYRRKLFDLRKNINDYYFFIHLFIFLDDWLLAQHDLPTFIYIYIKTHLPIPLTLDMRFSTTPPPKKKQ